MATTPLIIAEADHLAGERVGAAAQAAFRQDLRRGAYLVEWWQSAVDVSVEVAEEYADLGLGLADASLVALAERLEVTQIATFDERHFRALRPRTSHSAFELLPVDA